MPKVSVIIPVYNVEKYLKECLDSVINQTLEDIEIICINDGSTDNSSAILEEYAKNDSRIKIINLKENVGVGQARNIAFKEITADYLMFLDPDDWYEADACESAYNQIVKNSNDMVLFAFYNYYNETNHKKCKNLFKLKKYENISNIKFMDLDNPYSFLAPWYKIYSVKFLKDNEICFEDVFYYEDMQFFYQVIFANPDISILFKYLYHHRIWNGSITSLKKSFYDELQVRNRLLKKCIDYGNEKYLKFFIISYINTIYDKYTKFSEKDFWFKYSNYNKIRNVFINLNNIVEFQVIIDEIRYYDNIVKIKNNTLFIFIIKNLLNNIFSVTNLKDKSYKNLTILGLKIKI